jgi:acyl transferase domain-containing protein
MMILPVCCAPLQVLDATADGYVRGEACRAMWIEATDDVSSARVDPSTSKQPLAVIAGSSVNTNGRASSLTAPHGPSQQELIAVALAAGGLAAQDVTGIVLHANGTSLGKQLASQLLTDTLKMLSTSLLAEC